jgi:hypothetical protein
MTEKKTETAARRGCLAWQKARRVLGIGDRLRWLADWPDEMTPAELAALQYPREGPDSERRKALSHQRAMVEQLNTDIRAGELATVTVTVSRPKMEKRRINPFSLAHPKKDIYGNPVPVIRLEQVGETAAVQTMIERRPFAVWLDAQKEEAREHVRAWLGDAWPVAAAPAAPVKEICKPALDGDRERDIRAYHAERKRKQSNRPTLDTAEHFGISDGRVRQILRKKPSASAASLLALATTSATTSKKPRKS